MDTKGGQVMKKLVFALIFIIPLLIGGCGIIDEVEDDVIDTGGENKPPTAELISSCGAVNMDGLVVETGAGPVVVRKVDSVEAGALGGVIINGGELIKLHNINYAGTPNEDRGKSIY